jgi:uncharacterized protein YdaT
VKGLKNCINNSKGNKMAKGKDQHVVPHQDGWAVKGSGNSRATSIQPTQQKAIQDAVQIAKNQKSEVVIHGRDGKIRDKDSFGHDPFPPRDKKH